MSFFAWFGYDIFNHEPVIASVCIICHIGRDNIYYYKENNNNNVAKGHIRFCYVPCGETTQSCTFLGLLCCRIGFSICMSIVSSSFIGSGPCALAVGANSSS
jgi:hypothetical protein